MGSRDDRTTGPKPLANSAARRVEAIIEGAEKAAAKVIDDAEEKARDYLAEAEAEADRSVEQRLAALGELTDALVAQADAIQRQAELLSQSLREAKDRIEAEPGELAPERSELAPEPEQTSDNGATGAEEAPKAPHLAAVEPAEPSQPPDPPSASVEPLDERRSHGTPAGARLLATQMAVSGSSRQEIATRLRNGFEIEDADAILDAILGPEG